jgi:hypothetical protein
MKAVKTHLQETNPDRVAAFEKGAQELAKKIVGNFKDYEFYVGESMNPEGMVALLVSQTSGVPSVSRIGESQMSSARLRVGRNPWPRLGSLARTLLFAAPPIGRSVARADRQNYREDGTTPYFTFWKDGLKEMKI